MPVPDIALPVTSLPIRFRMHRLIAVIFVIHFSCLTEAAAGDMPVGAAGSPGRAHLDRPAAIELVGLEPGRRLSLDVERADTGGDWDGLKRDTLYFGFTQLAVIGVLYVSPQSVSGWSEDKKDEYSLEKYKDNIRNVVWDSDDWWINYILHPYWGGAYYVRATERGYGEAPSFWYSALLSTIYEFGAEALFEEPSIQDLIFTPGLGYFVGKYFNGMRQGIRMRVASGDSLTGFDRAKLVLTDPLGSVNRKINSLFGSQMDISVEPIVTSSAPPAGAGSFGETSRHAIERETSVVSGIQLRITW